VYDTLNNPIVSVPQLSRKTRKSLISPTSATKRDIPERFLTVKVKTPERRRKDQVRQSRAIGDRASKSTAVQKESRSFVKAAPVNPETNSFPPIWRRHYEVMRMRSAVTETIRVNGWAGIAERVGMIPRKRRFREIAKDRCMIRCQIIDVKVTLRENGVCRGKEGYQGFNENLL
jgi:hypothetical protein